MQTLRAMNHQMMPFMIYSQLSFTEENMVVVSHVYFLSNPCTNLVSIPDTRLFCKNIGHYYSYVRPDINENKWYRFDDQVVTPVDYNDVIVDAYGGTARRRRASSIDDSSRATKRQRGILRRIFSFGVFGRENGGGFGYGGRTSSAYMIQYVRRSDRDKLGY